MDLELDSANQKPASEKANAPDCGRRPEGTYAPSRGRAGHPARARVVLFPGMFMPLPLGREGSIAAAQLAAKAKRPIGVLLQRNPRSSSPDRMTCAWSGRSPVSFAANHHARRHTPCHLPGATALPRRRVPRAILPGRPRGTNRGARGRRQRNRGALRAVEERGRFKSWSSCLKPAQAKVKPVNCSKDSMSRRIDGDLNVKSRASATTRVKRGPVICTSRRPATRRGTGRQIDDALSRGARAVVLVDGQVEQRAPR